MPSAQPIEVHSPGDDFVEAAERALASGKLEQVSDAELERVMTAAVRLYAAKAEANDTEVRPVSAESRKMSATASALAAKATTIPVMTMACGTGSKRRPAAAPRRATMPKTRKTPLPIRLNASNLRRGCGWRMRP